MVLHEAADALYDLAAGLTFNRAKVLAGAAMLDTIAGDDPARIAAAASLRELAGSIAHDIDPVERKRAALLAAYVRQIAEQQQQTD